MELVSQSDGWMVSQSVSHSVSQFVWNLLHVTLMSPIILRCLLDLYKNCAPLI